MAITAITTSGITGIGATNKRPEENSYQPPKTTQNFGANADQIALTSVAKAKAMELQGISVSLIAAKLGVDTKTVNQYLGVTDTTDNSTPKTTYAPPKSTNAAAKSEATGTTESTNTANKTTTPDTPTTAKTASKPISADITKTTYTPPKSTFVEPKTTYAEPHALTQDRTKLASALSQLASIPHN